MENKLFGTAREASELRAFHDLEAEYDPHTALMLISRQLATAQISSEQFANFLFVRSKIHNGALDVSAAKKVAEANAAAALDKIFHTEPV